AEADVFTFPPFLIVYPLKAVYSDDDVGALKFSLGVAWNMSLERYLVLGHRLNKVIPFGAQGQDSIWIPLMEITNQDEIGGYFLANVN
ncbi:hypothetical protein DBR06_SOUSAS37910005, partial [Sousa chinensis]